MELNYISNDTKIAIVGSKLTEILGSLYNIELLDCQSKIFDEGCVALKVQCCAKLSYIFLKNEKTRKIVLTVYKTTKTIHTGFLQNDPNRVFKSVEQSNQKVS